MGTQVLARTWRPRLFKDIVGQDHITRTLMNALRLERLHHAYLFCGTRGVGKTTVARILAKSLLCRKRQDPEPCNSCPSCQAIDQGNYPDLIEVDAASRTKVEDTRDLLSDVQFAPTDGKYKIYLIDEVHMLSGHSFNALLKTLEEPPPHIIFLFATTEPQKLPMTMISRCLRFNLTSITESLIADRLQHVLTTEKIAYQPEAIELLAHYARGSMRDALSLVDQAIAYCDREIVHQQVADMLGTAQLVSPLEILGYLADSSLEPLLETTAKMEEAGGDFNELLDQLMAMLQDIAILQMTSSQSEADERMSLAEKLSAEEVQLFYQIALLTKKDLYWAPSPRRAVDMALLRMVNMQPLIVDAEWIAARSQQNQNLPHTPEPEQQQVREETEEEIAEAQPQPVAQKREEQKVETEAEAEPEQTEAETEEAEAQPREAQRKQTEAETEEAQPKQAEAETEEAEAQPQAEQTETDTIQEDLISSPQTEEKEETKEAEPQSVAEEQQPEAETEPEQVETETEQVEAETKEPQPQAEQTETETEQAEAEPEQAETETEQTEAETKETQPQAEQTEAETDQAEAEPEQPQPEPTETETEQAQPQAEQTQAETIQEDPSQPTQLTATTDYRQAHLWARLVENIDLTGLPASLLNDTRLVDQSQGMWLLRAPSSVCSSLEGNTKKAIEQALTQKLHQSILVDVEIGVVEDTPAMLKNETRRRLVEQVKQQPLVKNIIENFDGELDEETVQSTN